VHESPPSPERWLPVAGFEGLYEVSDQGRIRSISRKTASGVRGGKLLKGAPKNRYGHLKVSLTCGPVRVTRDIHRLVAEAFLGPCPPGLETRHGAGRTSDNRVVNLSYGTRSENSQDKFRDGVDNSGERQGAAKLDWVRVEEIRRRCAAGESRSSLARRFGVSVPCIALIVRGKTWRR